MTIEERILAMCSGDRESADLVLDTLARRVHTPEFCPTCLHELDESSFCSECGRLENNRLAPLNLPGTRGASQKET